MSFNDAKTSWLQSSVDYFSNNSPHTNVVGLFRAFLAVSSLISLNFTPNSELFAENLFEISPERYNLDAFSYFKLFGFRNLHFSIAFANLVLLIVLSGYFPKITSLVHFWIANSFIRVCPLVDGGDIICSNLSLLILPLIWTDHRRNHWSSAKLPTGFYSNMIAWFSIICIILQMSVLYLQAGVAKFELNEWFNGTAIYYWISNPTFGFSSSMQEIIVPVLSNKFFVVFFTWGTLVLEILLAGAIFFRSNYGKVFFWLGFSFHFMIWLVHGLPSFSFAMIAGLIVTLLPVEKPLNILVPKSESKVDVDNT